MNRLTWGLVVMISVLYIVAMNAICVLLFVARMRHHASFHRGEPFVAAPFIVLWVLCVLGPPILLTALYGRNKRRGTIAAEPGR
jgi:hypothetical protein